MTKPPKSQELDKIDLEIINLLVQDCRLSFHKIASKIGISSIRAVDRIKNLENKGIIKGYNTLLDAVKLGYDLTSIIFVQTMGGELKNVENELSQMSNVIAVYEVTGDFDLIALAKLKDKDSLNILIKDLLVTPHVKKTMTSIALNVVKEDFGFPILSKLGEL